ncbi:MAG: hypothetical protein H7138_03690, partial [Myxococcales bacterium]|nr:hypothetical protein [Myxococcales bacterium]
MPDEPQGRARDASGASSDVWSGAASDVSSDVSSGVSPGVSSAASPKMSSDVLSDDSSDVSSGIPALTLLDRFLAVLARWGVPVMMSGAYALLAVTSETDTAGQAWMAVGLAFVFVVWFVFRTLTETAALSRAIHVGDVARLFELAARQLPRAR